MTGAASQDAARFDDIAAFLQTAYLRNALAGVTYVAGRTSAML